MVKQRKSRRGVGNEVSAAIYRMPGNEDLDREEILRTHREATVRRMAQHGGTILAVQDTTSLNYNTQTKMEGIGYISDKTLGVNIHSCLAVTADGVVLGVLAQSSYNREKPSDKTRTHDSKKVRLLEEKESYRWVQTLGESAKAVSEGIHIVTVCDREGDMYELFDEADSKGQAFLIRIVQTLGESTETMPEGIHVVTVCDREGDMYELFDEADSKGRAFLIRIVQNRKTSGNEKILDAIRANRAWAG